VGKITNAKMKKGPVRAGPERREKQNESYYHYNPKGHGKTRANL
jgi:hypothetical protein